MNKFDDYTPHIFYGDDNDTSIDTEIKEEKKETKKRGRQLSTRTDSKEKNKTTKETTKKETKPASGLVSLKTMFSSRTTALVCGIILSGLSAYFIIAFVSYIGACLSDQSIIYNHEFGSIPQVSNKGGEGGARLSEFFINKGYGLGAFVLIVWLICISLKLLIGKPKFRTLDFTIKCLIGFITLSLIVGLLTIGTNTIINWGGYHGRYVNEWIIGFLGWWGAVILCIVMIALFITICMRDVIKWILAKKKIFDAKRLAIIQKRAEEKEKARLLEEQRLKEMELESISKDDHENETENENFNTPEVSFIDEYSYPETDEEISSFSNYNMEQEESESTLSENSVEQNEKFEDEGYKINDQELDETEDKPKSVLSSIEGVLKLDNHDTPELPKIETAFAKTPNDSETENIVSDQQKGTKTELLETQPMVVNVNQIGKAEKFDEVINKNGSLFRFPPLDLLKSRNQKIDVSEAEQLANQEKIKQTLLEYGVPIISIEAHVGPTVTLYEIRPDRGNRISRIKGLVDEIALSLAAIGVRIIAPIPGKGTIGIEVANQNPQTVALRSILESKKYQESKAALPIALGSTISSEVYMADLATMPHLLVAGATGQGKSVGLNVIIMSLLYKKHPDELKFVMFDPKMVEFNLYAAIQDQYLAKLPEETEAIVTDMNKVVPTLNSLCIEMDNRYSLLKEAEVRKIEEYNKLIKGGKFKDNPKHKYLPYIVVVIDEFADLIMTAGKEVEIPIARLAQKARAIGIHVIIATQRPTTTVITGNIKSNFPGRIAFKVAQGIDSKTILDTMGAQQLIGRGDMLILDNSELVRVQCAFIDTPEVKAICEHIGSQPKPKESPYILPEPTSLETGNIEGSSAISSGEKDPLYEEIKNYVIMSGIASTSNIQRKYQLGYNRAGRIMDQLEAEGIVGPAQGGKARSVLVG